MQLLDLWRFRRWARASFPQTAAGRALDTLAANVFGVTRISRRPRWWRWWWPDVWPFVESDLALRRRIAGRVRTITGAASRWQTYPTPTTIEKARKV